MRYAPEAFMLAEDVPARRPGRPAPQAAGPATRGRDKDKPLSREQEFEKLSDLIARTPENDLLRVWALKEGERVSLWSRWQKGTLPGTCGQAPPGRV